MKRRKPTAKTESLRSLEEVASGLSLNEYLMCRKMILEKDSGFANRVKFFKDNSGSPSMSVKLALAEWYAEEKEWTFLWTYDEDAWADLTEEDAKGINEILEVLLRDKSGQPLESLGGIQDPTRNYRRVIEAELAYEAMP